MASTNGLAVEWPDRGRAQWSCWGVLAVLVVAGVAGCSWETDLQESRCDESGEVSEDGRRICADGLWVEVGGGKAAGEACSSATQCESGQCKDGKCQPRTCDDGIRNGGEIDTDCGGPCGPCREGDRCQKPGHCWSRLCEEGTCVEKRCNDGEHNGAETDVDCGGPNCGACEVGDGTNSCKKNADCLSLNCAKPEGASVGKCANGTCSDGSKNRAETGVDCGGPCGPCEEAGAECKSDEDCAGELFCDTSGSGAGTCRSKKCTNDKKDPGETDKNCGDECPPCAVGKQCRVGSDCKSRRCKEDGTCAEPTCEDGVRNQGETDTDCGGPCEKGCGDGERCLGAGDCASGNCADDPDKDYKTCVAPGCNDGVKNGKETAVDCGGPTCDACDVMSACKKNRDCVNENCVEGTCEASCDDGLQNQGETDVDCGGMYCDGCAAGRSCTDGGDCKSGWCPGNTCKVRIAGKLTAKDPGRWSNGTYATSCDGYEKAAGSNFARKYVDVDLSKDQNDRNGIYKIKPTGANKAYPVYCQMLRHNARGGWTLAAVSADDGDDTWTWEDRALWTTQDNTTFGKPHERDKDYKSRAYHQLPFEDLMFVYRNGRDNPKWLAYDEVGDGSATLAAFTESKADNKTDPVCYAKKQGNDKIESGESKDAGNVSADEKLCSTDLYFNVLDQNGNNKCVALSDRGEHSFGPTWNVKTNSDCPMDDPGETGSFGPDKLSPKEEADGRGFGKALDLDTGEDRILMFVR